MKIRSLEIKNFKVFKDMKMEKIPDLCVIVGANGTGKSTFLQVFEFLKDAVMFDLKTAVGKLNYIYKLDGIRSIGANKEEPITIRIGFLDEVEVPDNKKRKNKKRDNKKQDVVKKEVDVTYELVFNDGENGLYIKKEQLYYKIRGKEKKTVYFKRGKNSKLKLINDLEFEVVVTNKEGNRKEEKIALNNPPKHILALKWITDFRNILPIPIPLPYLSRKISNLIKSWSPSDFQISEARKIELKGHIDMSPQGGGLFASLINISKDKRERIESDMKSYITDFESLDINRDFDAVRIRYKHLNRPVSYHHLSDGTIKLLYYLLLLNTAYSNMDPFNTDFPFLFINEPENHLYHEILWKLMEDFKIYAKNSQIFLTTHSTDFLDEAELDDVFWLEKEKGSVKVCRAKDNEYLKVQVKEGDRLGTLFQEGSFGNVHPRREVDFSVSKRAKKLLVKKNN
ncbi:chromosome segregation protein SMC [Spirochaetota bacterium]|nr:chromosome segregation protein SMC [Spirochaetota bacterium]